MFLGRPFDGKQLSRKKNKVKSVAKVKTGKKTKIRSNGKEMSETRASTTDIRMNKTITFTVQVSPFQTSQSFRTHARAW